MAHYTVNIDPHYRQKIDTFCNGSDPLKSGSLFSKTFPKNVDQYVLCDYFIMTDYIYSSKSFFKDYKSLDACKYFENGLVLSLNGRKFNDGFIVVGTVKDAEDLNESKNCWVRIAENGKVLCSHCQCLLSPISCCNHIGAILFALHDKCKDNESQQPAEEDDGVEELIAAAAGNSTGGSRSKQTTAPIPAWDDAKIDKFLHKMKSYGYSCPLMLIRQPFSDEYAT